MRHRRPLLTLVTALTLMGAACTEPPEQTAPAQAAGGAKEKPAGAHSFEKLHHAADHMGEWTLELVSAIDAVRDLSGRVHGKAVTLLARLDFLLREHVVLTSFATEAAVGGDPRAEEAALHAVETNTGELRRELVDLFDTDSAEHFARLWREHVHALAEYAGAVHDRDPAVARASKDSLDRFVSDFADFVFDLTGGQLEEAEVEAGMRAHVNTLIGIADAQSKGEAAWYQPVKAAVHEIAALAEGLAAGLAQAAVIEGDPNTEVAILRAELGGQLADSVFFTGYATRALLAGEEHALPATRGLLEDDTRELVATLGAALDREAAIRFGQIWSGHHEDFLAYAEAAKTDDRRGQQEILERLKHFTEELGGLLEAATEGHLGKDAVAKDAAKHVRTVTEMIDAEAEAHAAA